MIYVMYALLGILLAHGGIGLLTQPALVICITIVVLLIELKPWK
jgi:hypothetical protein